MYALLFGVEKSVSLKFHAHPSVLLVIGGVAVFFWWALTRLGPRELAAGRIQSGQIASRRNKNWLIAGVLVTLVFSYWPLHDIAEKYLFLAHMTQHTVFTLVSPVCFLLGAPDWLWAWVLRNNGLRKVMHFASKPIVALMVFNALIAITHWPSLVVYSLNNELFHFCVHAVLFLSATMMWIPVVNRRPELPQLNIPVKMMYLFAQSIVPTVPASFLTFSKKAMYSTRFGCLGRSADCRGHHESWCRYVPVGDRRLPVLPMVDEFQSGPKRWQLACCSNASNRPSQYCRHDGLWFPRGRSAQR
jgi:putative membrane protein